MNTIASITREEFEEMLYQMFMWQEWVYDHRPEMVSDLVVNGTIKSPELIRWANEWAEAE